MTRTALPPLHGIKVIDLTRHMSGPYATVSLGDFGADVIKVEPKNGGDASRSTGVRVQGKISASFLMWNRSKRSIALDLYDEEAKRLIRRLAADADVFIENFRPGIINKMGLDYDTLSAINPRLIYVSLSAFGEGPLGPYPGTDPVVQAMSGVMSVTGEASGGPVLVGVPVADFTAAMVAVQGVLLALFAREKTGRGQKVEVSMLHALLSSLTTRLASYWATGREPVRNGGAHSVVMPYQAWKTADGYAVAGVWNGANIMWPRFCKALGVPELAEENHYSTNELRLANKTQLEPLLAEHFLRRTTAEWERRFNAEGVLFSPVNTFPQILNHPHVAQADILGSLVHPELGELPQITPPIHLSETPGGLNRYPPRLGEHSREILSETGLSDEEIDNLIDAGIVEATP